MPARRGTTTRRRTIVLAGLVPVLLVALLKFFQPPLLLEARGLLFDSYQRLSPRPYRDGGVRIVDIDDETLRRLGQWPWPRGDVGALTKAIADAGAAAIAFDVVFSEPDRTSPDRLAALAARQGLAAGEVAAIRRLPDQDARFADVLGASPSVLGMFLTQDRSGATVQAKAGFAVAGSDPGASLGAYRGAIVPLPRLQEAAKGLGFVSLKGDADGIIRRVPLVAKVGETLLPSLSAEALRVAQEAGGFVLKSSDASGEVNAGKPEAVALKIGAAEVPVTERGELWMHYTGPVPQRVVPAWKILEGRVPPAEMQRLFSGRIVFVGTGAVGLRDLVSTPVADRELGVTLHAEAVEQMVLQDFLSRPDWTEGLEMAALLDGGVLLALALPWLGAFRGALAAGALVAAMGGGSWYAFREKHLLVDPVAPVLALLACYLVATVFTYLREEKQRRYIHGAFDRYLSPELVRRITDDPSRLELGGEVRDMTVLFCDIRGFSHISEGLGPQEIIGFLVAFLTPMTDILLARRATIDKYIGDAILAFWNAPLDDPDQHAHAARGALDMVARLEALNAEMPGRGDVAWPGTVEIGIGLNAGPCCVGNMGSAQRLSYSLIGDTVNLASRLEGLTKQYGVRIALGEALAAKLPGFALVELDRVRVVGRERPETVYALIGDETVADVPEFRSFAGAHAALLAAYRARSWDEAERQAAAIEGAAARYGLAKLYARYRALIEGFRTDPPPAGWDGVAQLKEK
ncbi:MAG: adenylate/guanylate cyclase domain-containing protein [Alphaproteobacteria bacterium]|nr:adenylate/guanylate cyclase domain-containing protein [Alphaproteobacteria bacterium]